jgi:hypothetical protein
MNCTDLDIFHQTAFLMSIKITFIIGQLSIDEFEQLKNGYSIISKMILAPDDFKLFHYNERDRIQVETKDGLRLWCDINHLEILKSEERVILIFTLSYAGSESTDSSTG